MSIFPNQLLAPRPAALPYKQNNCGLPHLEGAAHQGLAGSRELGNTSPRGREHQEDSEEVKRGLNKTRRGAEETTGCVSD